MSVPFSLPVVGSTVHLRVDGSRRAIPCTVTGYVELDGQWFVKAFDFGGWSVTESVRQLLPKAA